MARREGWTVGEWRKLLVNVSLSLGTALVFAGLLEGVARLVERRRPPREVADYIWDWRDKMQGEFYVIRSDGVGWPPWEEFNGDGLRDRTHPAEPPPGGERVVFLGDSVTLGDRLRAEEAYPQVLGQMLRAGGRRVEVFNVALWGWSTRQERIAFDRIVRRYAPTQVVLAVCLNDIPELQNNLTRPPRWMTYLHDRSALVRWVVNAEAKEIESVEKLFDEPDAQRVRDAMARFFEEVEALRRDVETSGARFAVVVFPFRFQLSPAAPEPVVQRRIAMRCSEAGLRCLDLMPALAELGEAGFVDYDHLSVRGARRVACTLEHAGLWTEPRSHLETLALALHADADREAFSRWAEEARTDAALPCRDPAPDTRARSRPPGRLARSFAELLTADEAEVRAAGAWGLWRLGPEAFSTDATFGRALVATLATRATTDPEAQVRVEALRALGAAGAFAHPAAGSIFPALRDPHQQVRWAAADALSLMSLVPADDAERLAAAVGSDDKYVRGFASFALGEMGAAASVAVPALAAALDGPHGYSRASPASALGRMGAAAAPAVPALVRGLGSPDDDTRWKAARALGRIGPAASAAVPQLIGALRDPNEYVSGHAARALWNIDPAAARRAVGERGVALKEPEDEKAERGSSVKPSPGGKP